MALTQLPPLDKKQWKFVVETLKKEPTEEQKKRTLESIQNAKKIKTQFD